MAVTRSAKRRTDEPEEPTEPARAPEAPAPEAPEEGAADGSEERDYSVRAVARVCAILNLLQESVDGVSLIDVAEATGLPKSSAFRYLWTLETRRYVERDPATGMFRLGLGFVGMQSRHLEVLRQRARPVLERLRDELGETLNLGVLDGDTTIYLDIVESRRGVRLAATRGDRDPIHSTALGKAIAARLPEAQVRGILAAGMPARTANTITTPEDYLNELGRVRRLGYAFDDGENEIDGRCLAVPIEGTPFPAALSLSAPSARFPLRQVEEVATALKAAAATLTAAPDVAALPGAAGAAGVPSAPKK
ncbi:IclR family transcriptional regulator [Catenulispora sp. NL8]|uniref:IclR family transcriptional regulator n=1 Tax=Catenulispora pinistramenti TaxID=2705254 RepID=A0ABS5KPM8_9ACTN|nr:IclR family transcriptional regulator [Catenulispora pinistramenti]MBS2547999.1 IclR family transcriptional regulator [Catenulispora pinistramenti]